jgi:O2-independent ubiquinone biosynthesis accessory factor UbiT
MKPFKLPKSVSKVFSTFPQYPHSFLFAQAINLHLAETLHSEVLTPLHGKLISIHVIDASVVLHFTLNERGITPRRADKTPDLTISASAHDFMQLAMRKEDPDTLFFSRRLLMEGDTELGLLVKNTLDALELPPLDWRSLMPGRVMNKLKGRLLQQP